jgi:hypothetical protein
MACESVADCPAGQRCVDRRCTEVRREVDAATPDAGSDAATTDAGSDAATTDAGSDAATTDAGSDAATTDAGPECPADACEGVSCSGRGWCRDGTCACQFGYAGAECERCEAWPGTSPFCAPSNIITGTEEADTLGPGPEDDYIRGLGGDDSLRGGPGNDLLTGDSGNDFLNGNEGADVVYGGDGDDQVLGGQGSDFLSGGPGNDRIVAGGGTDRLEGGPGDDLLIGEAETFIDGAEDWYWIDGLGADEIIDDGDGSDVATCAPGVYVVDRRIDGADLRIELNTGGSVLVRGDAIERFIGCECP